MAMQVEMPFAVTPCFLNQLVKKTLLAKNCNVDDYWGVWYVSKLDRIEHRCICPQGSSCTHAQTCTVSILWGWSWLRQWQIKFLASCRSPPIRGTAQERREPRVALRNWPSWAIPAPNDGTVLCFACVGVRCGGYCLCCSMGACICNQWYLDKFHQERCDANQGGHYDCHVRWNATGNEAFTELSLSVPVWSSRRVECPKLRQKRPLIARLEGILTWAV